MREVRLLVQLPGACGCISRRTFTYAAPPGVDVSNAEFAYWMTELHARVDKHVARITTLLGVAQAVQWLYLVFFLIAIIIALSSDSAFIPRSALWAYGLIPLLLGILSGCLQHVYQSRLNRAITAIRSFLDGHVNNRMLRSGFKWQLEQAPQRRFACAIGTWIPIYEIHVLPAVAVVPVDTAGAPLHSAVASQLDVSAVAGFVVANFIRSSDGSATTGVRTATVTITTSSRTLPATDHVSVSLSPTVIAGGARARGASGGTVVVSSPLASLPPMTPEPDAQRKHAPEAVVVNPLSAMAGGTTPVPAPPKRPPEPPPTYTPSTVRVGRASMSVHAGGRRSMAALPDFAEFASHLAMLEESSSEQALLSGLQSLSDLVAVNPRAIPPNGHARLCTAVGALLAQRPALITSAVNTAYERVSGEVAASTS